ncbi:hypothetical protein ACFPVX_04405 [Cohnella faecalis]|uniref:Uncharacterized protein n=1 Tax=Cohnella faecalis TaxID=2315694 RepID=A0A398CKP0_9BACL|nr:hypothetical protein [Cohnella faecalis]RIE03876.1 hypothetical protein D3H35_07860 [Cohnella faecalis]
MAQEDSGDKRLKEAVKLLRKGVDGDKKAAKDAYERFVEIRAANPSDALIEAYYGSALALTGRDAVKPLDRSDKAQQGLDALDRAVAMNPERAEIRLIRAGVCSRLPEDFFHRTKTAVEDFEWLLSRHRTDPGSLTDRQLIQVLLDLGAAYEKTDKPEEAKAAWKRLAQLDPKYKHLAK